MYCQYYQANVLRKKTWFLSAVMRNESNMAFARAIEGNSNMFEFFVPKDQEDHFLYIMDLLQKRGIILSFGKKENRLKAPSSDA